MRYLILPLCFIFMVHCTSTEYSDHVPINQYEDSIAVRIAQLQNDGGAHELVAFLKHDNIEYRSAAALAYASIQDSTFVSALGYRLSADTSALVRNSIAYSLGQIGTAGCFDILKRTFPLEQDQGVKNQILEAIGKCNTSGTAQFLENIDQLSPGLLWGIYRTLPKEIISPILLEKSVEGLRSDDAETQLAASHVLGRMSDIDLTPYRNYVFQFLQNNLNEEAIIALARSLKWIYSEDKTAILESLLTHRDYRVVVNSIRTIDSSSAPFVRGHVSALLTHSNNQVFQSTIDLIASFPECISENKLFHHYQATETKDRKISLAGLLLNFGCDNKVNDQIKSFIIQSQSLYDKKIGYKALSKNPSNDQYLIEQFNNTEHPVLKGFLFDFIPDHHFTFPFLKECMSTNDIALICLAAHKLKEIQFKDLVANDIQFFLDIQSNLSLPVESEAWLEINRMLCLIDESVCDKSLPYTEQHSIDWNTVSSIEHAQKILIETEKGHFTIQLNVNEAPGAVSEIYALINEGFYDGKTFHRVVPNFVAQGGCPRGDGWGSLDFSLRSELGPLKYRTGTVGLASAGKDTESCQFFITHSPTPHLEGKYTIIGQVVEGMDVVHQLSVGDELISVVAL